MSRGKRKDRDPNGILIWPDGRSLDVDKFNREDVEFLEKAIAKGREGIPDLMSCLDHLSDAIRHTTVKKLAELNPLPDAELTVLYEKFIRGETPSIQWAMAEAFPPNATRIIPMLMREFEIKTQLHKDQSRIALGFKFMADQVIPEMTTLVEDPDPRARRVAYEVIGEALIARPDLVKPQLIQKMLDKLSGEKLPGPDTWSINQLILTLAEARIMLDEIINALSGMRGKSGGRFDDGIDETVKVLKGARKTGMTALEREEKVKSFFEQALAAIPPIDIARKRKSKG